jgi:hypothetical protein
MKYYRNLTTQRRLSAMGYSFTIQGLASLYTVYLSFLLAALEIYSTMIALPNKEFVVVQQKALTDEVWSAWFGAMLLERLLKSNDSAMVESIALGLNFWDGARGGAEKVKACFEELHGPGAFQYKKNEETKVKERLPATKTVAVPKPLICILRRGGYRSGWRRGCIIYSKQCIIERFEESRYPKNNTAGSALSGATSRQKRYCWGEPFASRWRKSIRHSINV